MVSSTLPVSVDDRDLAAVAVAGVEAHRDRALDRRLHEAAGGG